MPFIKGKYPFCIRNANLEFISTYNYRKVVLCYIGGSFSDSISDRSWFFKRNSIIVPASGRSKIMVLGGTLPNRQNWGEPPGIPTGTG